MASTEPQPFLLSPIDNSVSRLYTSKYLFFPESGNTDASTVVDTLRHAFSQTLRAIPGLSGTVQVIDERGALAVAAPWNNVDDVFLVNDLRQEGGPEYRTLRDRHFPITDLDESALCPLGGRLGVEKIVPSRGREVKSETPACCAQVTIIKGGLILGLFLNHNFTDGNGAPVVAQVWAAYCRGDDGSRLVTPEMIDRKPVMQGWKGTSLADFPEFEIRQTEEKSPSILNHIYTTLSNWLITRLPKWSTSSKEPEGQVPSEYQFTTFFFPKSKLAELKTMASARENGDFGDRWISTIDALSALIGCCIASVRDEEIRMKADNSWVITTVLGARRLLDPPLPTEYIGNLLSLIRIHARNPTIKPTAAKVAEIAHLLRDRIKQRGDAYHQGLIGALSSVEDFTRVKMAPLSPSEAGIMITSWANQNFYDIEWGEVVGGRTERVRATRLDYRYICRILPEMKAPRFADDECGLEVVFGGLDKDEVARLMQNELFMKFAQWRSD